MILIAHYVPSLVIHKSELIHIVRAEKYPPVWISRLLSHMVALYARPVIDLLAITPPPKERWELNGEFGNSYDGFLATCHGSERGSEAGVLFSFSMGSVVVSSWSTTVPSRPKDYGSIGICTQNDSANQLKEKTSTLLDIIALIILNHRELSMILNSVSLPIIKVILYMTIIHNIIHR